MIQIRALLWPGVHHHPPPQLCSFLAVVPDNVPHCAAVNVVQVCSLSPSHIHILICGYLFPQWCQFTQFVMQGFGSSLALVSYTAFCSSRHRFPLFLSLPCYVSSFVLCLDYLKESGRSVKKEYQLVVTFCIVTFCHRAHRHSMSVRFPCANSKPLKHLQYIND